MSELREVFEMVTKQTEPDVDAWREQERRQRRTARNRKLGALAMVASIGIVAVVVVIRAAEDRTGTQPVDRPPPTTSRTVRSIPPEETLLEPGRYVMSTHGLPDFNASHRITIDVPEGYLGFYRSVVLKPGTETGVALWSVGYTFHDACNWMGTRSAISSTDDLVAALAGQKALHPSTPTDIRIDGFAGTYMEVTVPARDPTGAKLGRCGNSEFRVWADAVGRVRYLNNWGQTDHLWILEVDGAQLVIDAPIAGNASAQERAEVLQMVESIRIGPR
jgi:hypothetical protein